MNGKARAGRRRLFGPAPDLLFGCGLAYALVFAVQVAAGPQLRELVPLAALTLTALLASTPHYGATLFALWGTVALCALF